MLCDEEEVTAEAAVAAALAALVIEDVEEAGDGLCGRVVSPVPTLRGEVELYEEGM